MPLWLSLQISGSSFRYWKVSPEHPLLQAEQPVWTTKLEWGIKSKPVLPGTSKGKNPLGEQGTEGKACHGIGLAESKQHVSTSRGMQHNTDPCFNSCTWLGSVLTHVGWHVQPHGPCKAQNTAALRVPPRSKIAGNISFSFIITSALNGQVWCFYNIRASSVQHGELTVRGTRYFP